jgi:hypothetical protein
MILMKHKVGMVALLVTFFAFAGVSYALDLTIEPASAQRTVGGKVRINIYANSASNLISYGIKLTFNPAVLQVESAGKYFNASTLDGWLMDADGLAGTTPSDQYTTPDPVIDPAGSVTMIGGRLTGTSTTGLSGKVLLGYVVFNAVGNGNSNLALSVAKAPPFDNFVAPGTPPTVYDGDVAPVGNPTNKGIICVAVGAIPGDVNGNGAIDSGDFALLRTAMGKSYPDPSYNVKADFNGNGAVDSGDFAILRANMGKTALTCP